MIVDLFAGPGGWDVGAHALGLAPIGIEADASACATRAAAGLTTIRADVTTIDPARLRGRLDGLIASPPCTDFSMAGRRAGITGATGALMAQVPRFVEVARPRWVACEQVPPALPWWEAFAHDFGALGYRCWTGILNAADYGVAQTRRRAFLLAHLDRAPLAPEPTHAKNPAPGLFGIAAPWVTMAEALGWGLSARPYPTIASGRDTGGPDREKVGGSRDRAILYDEQAAGRFVLRDIGRNGAERTADEPAMTIPDAADNGNYQFVVNTGRDWKPGGTREDAQRVPIDEPAPAIDGKGRWHLEALPVTVETGNFTAIARNAEGERDADGSIPYERPTDEPAPTVTPQTERWKGWPDERPATTIVGDGRAFGPHSGGGRGESQSHEAIRLTIVDALILQSFPPDYPVTGTKTKQFEQIGNAVPPLLAAHVLAAVTGARLQ